jgi:hypothetical protein
VLDLLSVFVFRAGMFGVGLASGLSYLSALAVSSLYFRSRECPFRFRWRSLTRSTGLAIAKSGSPVIFAQLIYTIRVYCFNQMLLSLGGTLAVAAFAVISTLADLIYCIHLGAGAVTLMLTSMFYEEEDRFSLGELVSAMISHSLVLVCSASALCVLAARWLTTLFLGDNPAVLSIAVPGLRLYALALIPCAVSTQYKYYFQGVQHIENTYLAGFLESLGCTTLLSWLLSRFLGLRGVWLGLPAGQLATLFIICILIWRKYGAVSFSKEAFLYLDPDFGASDSECLNLSVSDTASAIVASQQVYGFCRDKTAGHRTATLLSLCVEELTINILRHGLSGESRPHNIDLRLVAQGEQWVLRIRDDCQQFDPLHYLELHRDEDPCAHIGLRMVMGMVQEANYVNSLGLNHLTLTVSR